MRNSVFAVLLLTPFAGNAQQSCESLASLKLQHATITSAVTFLEGPVAQEAKTNTPPPTAPARCVVKAIARPSADSEIKFELWLPVRWNGKYRQVGNGGWAGVVPAGSLIAPVKAGYAAAGTDDGHPASGGAEWAIGHPEKLIDFGYRAVHETSVQAKAIIQAFYGKDVTRAYFFGCSDGGREALMEAQRYPEDFDGIVAGAPANYWSRLMTGFVWNEQALLKDSASAIPPAKLPLIQARALAACDALDGVRDGLVEDPRTCHFDPSVLACKSGDAPDCLTAPQLDALRKIYEGPKNPRTGQPIFPGYAPGTEAGESGWSAWIASAPADRAIQFAFANSYYGQAVFEQQKWDFRTIDFDADFAFGNRKAGSILNSDNPDLRSFRDRGGKLIQYHGWGDAAIAPLSSIEYYESVRAFLGRFPDGRGDASRPVDDFYRLFMVPGMGHCGGAVGPNNFGNSGGSTGGPDTNVVAALEQWVEKGIAPQKIIAKGVRGDDRTKALTRPLCPYPQVAKYKGAGDPDDAGSFVCAVPAR
jgi:feruloyl esterase